MKPSLLHPDMVLVLALCACACASRPAAATDSRPPTGSSSPVEPVSAAPGTRARGVSPADPAYWRADAQGRASANGGVASVANRSASGARQVDGVRERAPALSARAQLETARVTRFVVADEESLSKVIGLLRDVTGLPLVVAPAAERAALDAGVIFDFALQNPIGARDLLNLIVGQTAGAVEWTVKHDAIVVTTPEKARGEHVLVMHDIQALTMVRTDFLAPRLDRLRLLDELEDDDGGGPFGGIGEQTRRMEEEDVAALVQESVAVGTWEQDGVSIEVANGFLFVVHAPEVQRRITLFLLSLGGP